MSIKNIIEHAETYFEQVVEQGSEQQLFIAGYLQGHFSLVLARVVQQSVQSADAFKHLLLESLDKAFAKNELEGSDQTETMVLVEQLFALEDIPF